MILQHTASVQVTSLRDNPVLVSTVNLYIWRLCTSSALKKAKLKPPTPTVGELKISLSNFELLYNARS